MEPTWNGWLVIDKPQRITSRGALDRVKRWFPRKTRIGHTGTLDPLATGVLVVAIGQATKQAEAVQAMPKVYRAAVRLGCTSDTDDADGTVTETSGCAIPTEEQITRALPRFLGTILQLPPKFSALKVEGRRAYDLARKGQEVELKPRPVSVYSIRLLRYEWPLVELEIECGKGTYIRSIARDLGEALGTGGMIEQLRRTKVGPFAVEQGISVNEYKEDAWAALIPLESGGTVSPC
jgi:tRNA pseudouridine55 synthase